jgi:hypothetical protein
MPHLPGRTGPPWTMPDTLFFHGEFLSNFAPTPGLRLPFGYHGHHENDRLPVRTVEHWFQACKATSRQQFDLILACGTPGAAKQAGRETELRPDWEQVKFEVMLCRARQVRAGALPLWAVAHPAPAAGGGQSERLRVGVPRPRRRAHRPEPDGGHTGQNLLGLALMRVRDELIADVRTRLSVLRGAR